MSKKFAEHKGLNLTQTNNDVLQMWKEKNVFWRSVTEREGCPQDVEGEKRLLALRDGAGGLSAVCILRGSSIGQWSPWNPSRAGAQHQGYLQPL